ncbi:MAG: four helix bundle protein [Acidobacteria bacterium]|nr:four helix bundle protein [Acidobacteriota bacterium]
MRDEKDNSSGARSGDEKKNDLKKRLKEYALRIIRLYEALPKTGAVHVITHQLLRSGTSPGAQYREACRAKSDADFISKIEGALQELEESDYWLELLIQGGYETERKLKPLCDETNELIAIFVSIVLKIKARKKRMRGEE